jgi:hypothetical protein
MNRHFDITSVVNTVEVNTATAMHGQCMFTVKNVTGQALRTHTRMVVEKPEQESWFQVAGGADREFTINAIEHYTIQIDVPAGTTAGVCQFRPQVYAVDDPTEITADGPTVTLAVGPSQAPPPPPIWQRWSRLATRSGRASTETGERATEEGQPLELAESATEEGQPSEPAEGEDQLETIPLWRRTPWSMLWNWIPWPIAWSEIAWRMIALSAAAIIGVILISLALWWWLIFPLPSIALKLPVHSSGIRLEGCVQTWGATRVEKEVLINWRDDTADWVSLDEKNCFEKDHSYQGLPSEPPSATVVDTRGRHRTTAASSFDAEHIAKAAKQLLKSKDKECVLIYFLFQSPLKAIATPFTPIPPGEFEMGEAAVKVHISQPFYLSRRVTQELWDAVMQNVNSPQKKEMSGISWTEIQIFMQRLNEREPGSPFRLPTEAEWEYAAKHFLKQNEDAPEQQEKWIWMSDRYGVLPSREVTDPTGPKVGLLRVIRNLEKRRFGTPNTQGQNLGFRILRQMTESSDEGTSFGKMFSGAEDAATRKIVQLARDINPEIEQQIAAGVVGFRNLWGCLSKQEQQRFIQ